MESSSSLFLSRIDTNNDKFKKTNNDNSLNNDKMKKTQIQIQPSSESTSPQTSINDEQKSSPKLYLLYSIIILQTFIFLTEMILDQMIHSLLILTDAYHHLFNSFNAILLVVCYKISNQITIKNTFGWVRMELLGMLTTITFIVALIFSLLIEGALQLLHLHEISSPTNSKILLIFGCWSLIVNILYVFILNEIMTDKKYKQKTEKERSFSTAKCRKNLSSTSSSTSSTTTTSNQTEKSNDKIKFSTKKYDEQQRLDPPSTIDETSCIELMSLSRSSSSSISSTKSLEKIYTSSTTDDQDNNFCHSFIQGILSPCFVLFCSLLIKLIQYYDNEQIFKIEMIDPVIGVLTAITLCITFYPQLKNTFLILMQTIPENVNINKLKRELLDKYQIIENIHELHVWLLNDLNIVITCHIVLPKQQQPEYNKLFNNIKKFLQYKYGIRYITIQPEFTIHNHNISDNNNDKKQNNKNNHHYHNYNDQNYRNKCRYSTTDCKNQCLFKCPCDQNGNCQQCLLKSCCLNINDDNGGGENLNNSNDNIDV